MNTDSANDDIASTKLKRHHKRDNDIPTAIARKITPLQHLLLDHRLPKIGVETVDDHVIISGTNRTVIDTIEADMLIATPNELKTIRKESASMELFQNAFPHFTGLDTLNIMVFFHKDCVLHTTDLWISVYQ